jgi:hypothetical protein
MIEIVCTSTGVIFILPQTDVSKTSVRNDLQRTGAELFDFLVFRKYFDQILVAKNERVRWSKFTV